MSGVSKDAPVMNEYDFEGERGEGAGADGTADATGLDVCVVDDTISLSDFRSAVVQLGLTGDDSIGLTAVEVDQLMRSADRDGNGVVDFEEFQVGEDSSLRREGDEGGRGKDQHLGRWKRWVRVG